ncbi:hypothetical protein E8E11_008526 [Didymella keratinophila]|nr:hypothetical protein E8E11_008526 [Didymella keratinophila]
MSNDWGSNDWGGNADGWGTSSQGVGNRRMIPQYMHVKQITAKDTAIAEKDATIAKQKDTLNIQEFIIKRLTADNDALKAAHQLEIEKLKQKDGLTTQELTIKRLNTDIEALKAAHEEEIESFRQRWEKEANQCSRCQKEGHEESRRRVHVKVQGSVIKTFSRTRTRPEDAAAFEDDNITLANVTVHIADAQINLALQGVTINDLRACIEEMEKDYDQNTLLVRICLYMDSITTRKAAATCRRAFKEFLAEAVDDV